MTGRVLMVLALWLTGTEVVLTCTALSGPPQSWVVHADVIVRVKAPPVSSRTHLQAPLGFVVIEVLKGNPALDTIEVEGALTGSDDRNDLPVPYTAVRSEGRRGNCYARTYRPDGEYLLLLRRVNGRLTPYWASLGATNEQLFGPTDEWLLWVRGQLKPPQR